MNKIVVSAFISVLLVIVSVSYSFASIDSNVAKRALPYAIHAAEFTETFYETATVDVPNADHAYVLLGDVTASGLNDPRIAVAQNDLREAHALLVQAHNLGQQADSYTKAIVRDLQAAQ